MSGKNQGKSRNSEVDDKWQPCPVELQKKEIVSHHLC